MHFHWQRRVYSFLIIIVSMIFITVLQVDWKVPLILRETSAVPVQDFPLEIVIHGELFSVCGRFMLSY